MEKCKKTEVSDFKEVQIKYNELLRTQREDMSRIELALVEQKLWEIELTQTKNFNEIRRHGTQKFICSKSLQPCQ